MQTRYPSTNSYKALKMSEISIHQLKSRLESLDTTIAQICAIAGTPGISVGVTQNGSVVHQFSHGLRDIEQKRPFTPKTLIPIGTMAKTFTASAVGILVSQGKLTWSTPICSILPGFRSSDPVVEAELNVTDLLCHRAGLARSNFWWQGADNQLLIRKEDLLPFYARLPRTGVFRGEWGYSNWGYALVGAVIEQLSGLTYGEFIDREILQPLGLDATTFHFVANSNGLELARGYAALDNASPFALPLPPVNDTTIMTPAMGGVSSAEELTKYSIALLKSHALESEGAVAVKQEYHILKHALRQLSGHIFTAPDTMEKSYAFGWYRSQLPGQVLGMGWNSIYVKSMPRLEPGVQSGPIVAHGGSLPGYHTAIALLPALQSSVVVCTNSIALGDVSGWVSLAIAEALIDSPSRTDFVALATEAAKSNVSNVHRLQQQLETTQKHLAKNSIDTALLHGTYRDPVHGWILSVQAGSSNGLEIVFGDLSTQRWPLSYYGCEAQGETFLWLRPREEQAKRCRMTTYPLVANHFRIIFKIEQDGSSSGLYWPHEAGIPVEQQFFARLQLNYVS